MYSSCSRHGFVTESEEILSVFKDLSAEERLAVRRENVVKAMVDKGYSCTFVESYLKPLTEAETISVEELKQKLEKTPLPTMEIEFARLRRIFNALGSYNADSIGPADIPKFTEEAEKCSRLFRADIKFAVAHKDEHGRLPFSNFSAFLLEKATRTACSSEEEENLVRSFQEFDRDGNGYLTLGEVVELMERRGYPSIFARVFLDALDSDGDFMITLDEYKQKLSSKSIPVLDSGMAELRRLFALLDKDGNGFLEAEDLRQYIEEAESASRFFAMAIRDAINTVDQNKDGKITFEELVNYIKNKAPVAPAQEEEYLLKRFRDLQCEKEDLATPDVIDFMVKDGYQPMFVRKFLEAVDVNHDKTVSMEEYVVRMRNTPIPLEEANFANLSRAFAEIDKEGSGFVRLDELLTFLDDTNSKCQDWFRRSLQVVAAKVHGPKDKRLSFRELEAGLRLEAQNRSLG